MESAMFHGVSLADAEILDFASARGNTTVRIKDWQENEIKLDFDDVLAMEAFSADGLEISHCTEDADDPFIQRARQITNESTLGYRCFTFYGADDGSARMRIVAQRVQVYR